MKKIFSFVLLILLIVGLCVFPSTSVVASAARQQINCNPLDLIFLVDQTSKMQQADPNDLRLKAIQWAIMLLGYDHMYNCPDASYRIGVISYGGQTSLVSNVITDIPLTEVTPRLGQGLNSWRSEWRRLVTQLKEPAGNRSRNLLDAIQTANKTLDSANDGRKQALIIFNADWGSPCVCTPSDAQQIIEDSKWSLPSLGNNRSLWFYAFPDDLPEADFEGYAGKTWEKLLNDIAPDSAKFIRVPDTSAAYGLELAKDMADIFFSANNRAGILVESGCSFAMPDFVKRMGILIYKLDNTVKTAIDDSDPQTPAIVESSTFIGSMKVTDSPNGIPNGNVEPFVIDRPIPGDWMIRECAGSMYVLRFQSFADHLASVDAPVELPQYSDPNLPDQLSDPNQRFDLKFQLTDDDGKAVIQHEGVEPVISGQVEMPDSQKLPLEFVYDSNMILYRSKGPLPTRQIGSYPWKIIFKRNVQAEPLVLQDKKYVVKKVAPVRLVVDLPFANSTTIHEPCFFQPNCFLNLNTLSIPISARFVDESDVSKSIRFRELFPDSEQTIEATLTHTQSRKKQTVFLQPSLTDSYTFNGIIGDQLDLQGEYLLEITLQPEQISKMNFLYRFFSDATEAQVKFTRIDTTQTNPMTYFGIFSAVLLITFAMLLRCIWVFTNPIDGYLIFSRLAPSTESSNQYKELAAIPLSSLHKRDRVFSHTEIARKSRLLHHLASIKAWKVRKNGQSAIELMLQLDHPSVQDKNAKMTLFDEERNQEKLPGGIYISYTSAKTEINVKDKALSNLNPNSVSPASGLDDEQDTGEEN